eukprot:scaffold392325_cov36-Prasinocladus_malaysianus.AAC.1
MGYGPVLREKKNNVSDAAKEKGCGAAGPRAFRDRNYFWYLRYQLTLTWIPTQPVGRSKDITVYDRGRKLLCEREYRSALKPVRAFSYRRPGRAGPGGRAVPAACQVFKNSESVCIIPALACGGRIGRRDFVI